MPAPKPPPSVAITINVPANLWKVPMPPDQAKVSLDTVFKQAFGAPFEVVVTDTCRDALTTVRKTHF